MEEEWEKWRGSYSKTVEFLRANRGPISEKNTCKVTDEPIASQDVHRLTSGLEVGKILHLMGGGADFGITFPHFFFYKKIFCSPVLFEDFSLLPA